MTDPKEFKRLKSLLQSFTNEASGPGDQETLVHVFNHMLEAAPIYGEGQFATRESGAGGDVEHATKPLENIKTPTAINASDSLSH